MEGSIVSKKPGVINMPSWKGVINDAQADAIAAYILAGFPHTGATYDPDPAKAERHLHRLRLHRLPRPGRAQRSRRRRRPTPKTADKAVPALRNPDDDVPLSELRSVIMDGLDPGPRHEGRASSCRRGVRS